MSDEPYTGVLLVQLGTPDGPDRRSVRRYLAEFLSDPRVLDIPRLLRWLLLRLVILPFRPKRSAEAYEKIWTVDGSPLIIHTRALAEALTGELGPGFKVTFGMRYQNPSLRSAVAELAGCERVVVVPLFPQYSSAATGSALEETMRIVGSMRNVPPVSVVGDFYDDPGWVDAVVEVASTQLSEFPPDHVLFSYHGLPQSQIRKSDPDGWCLQRADCCETVGPHNRFCYRAQCFATTRAIASRLAIPSYDTTFQSRLAPQKWIPPYTDRELASLREAGVNRLAVLTPSFVADCLETLEEIGIRLRNQWDELGGEAFLLVPCVNASPRWVSAVADMVRARA